MHTAGLGLKHSTHLGWMKGYKYNNRVNWMNKVACWSCPVFLILAATKSWILRLPEQKQTINSLLLLKMDMSLSATPNTRLSIRTPVINHNEVGVTITTARVWPGKCVNPVSATSFWQKTVCCGLDSWVGLWLLTHCITVCLCKSWDSLLLFNTSWSCTVLAKG